MSFTNIEKGIESLIDDKDDLEKAKESLNNICCYNNNPYKEKYINKKIKIKKMKNYNIKKGDWQCKHCYNINFHFRIRCNICNESR